MQYMTTPEVPEALGYLGEIRQGPDGQFYQLSQTVDGLGNVGFTWLPALMRSLPTLVSAGRTLAPMVSQFAQQAMPLAQQLMPLLSSQGAQGLGQEALDQPQLGEVRAGPDGQLYQYAQTVDGLGNIGFAWASLIPMAAQALPAIASLFSRPSAPSAAPAAPPPSAAPAAPARGLDLSQLIPQIAQVVASLLSRRRRPAGVSGFGEEADLYQVPPGVGQQPDESLGLTEDELGLTEDELSLGDYYLGEDGGVYEFQGLDEDVPEELRGLDQYPDEPLGLTEEEPISGMEGYLREQPESRLQGYVTGHPPASPPFVSRANPSPLWQSLW